MQRFWIAGIVTAALLLLSRGAFAATLLSAQLIIDGSSMPPGDRLHVVVILDPGESDADIEVRAFVAEQDAMRNVTALKAPPGAPQGADQELLLRGRATGAHAGELATADIDIPFAMLALPVGLHELGYEVRVLAAGEVVASQALPMTFLQVTTEVRKMLRPRLAVEQPRDEAYEVAAREADAYVLQDGQLRKETVKLPAATVPRLALPTEPVPAEIPGEYVRVLAKRTAPRPMTREVPDVVVEQELAELKHRPWAALSRFEPQPKRTVFFATNRALVKPDDTTYRRFGNTAASQLTYGKCVVNIPIEVHRKGVLELPGSWWPVEDPKKHFLLENIELIELANFREGIAEGDVLLFVHGYNTRFDFAVLRAAQLTHDLEFPGKSVAFVWPSAGSTRRYAHDEEQAAQSVDPLVVLLRELSESVRASGNQLHVIAHSMGNRIFLAAARQWELDRGAPASTKLLGRVVLAAPDVDAATFAALVPTIIRLSDRTTLYYCEKDRALEASRLVHLNKPVGLGPFFMDGLDTINADNANTSFMGHGYFAEGNRLLLDLRLLTLFKLAPEERRPPLAERSLMFGFPHWTFRTAAPAE